MEILSLILLGVRSISTVLANPALGGGANVRFSEASELLNLLASLIAQGVDARSDLEEFTTFLEEMAATGRAPTPTEWAVLRSRSDAAHAALQAAKEAILAEEEENSPEPPAPPTPTSGDPTGPGPAGEPAGDQGGGEPEPTPV